MNSILGILIGCLAFASLPSTVAAKSIFNETSEMKAFAYDNESDTIEIYLDTNPYLIRFPEVLLKKNVTIDSFAPASQPMKTYRQLGFLQINYTNFFSPPFLELCFPPKVWDEDLKNSVMIEEENDMMFPVNSTIFLKYSWICEGSSQWNMKTTYFLNENGTRIMEAKCCQQWNGEVPISCTSPDSFTYDTKTDSIEIYLDTNPHLICFPYSRLETDTTLDSVMPSSQPLKTYRQLGFLLTNLTIGTLPPWLEFCLLPEIWNEDFNESIIIEKDMVFVVNSTIFDDPSWNCDLKGVGSSRWNMKTTYLLNKNGTRIIEGKCCQFGGENPISCTCKYENCSSTRDYNEDMFFLAILCIGVLLLGYSCAIGQTIL